MNYCLDTHFIQYSLIYGRIDIHSKLFDDSKDLGGTEENLLENLIKKVKIYTKNINNKQIISGIQLAYQNIRTREIKELPIRFKDTKNYKNDQSEETEIFELKSGEYLTKFYIRFALDAKYIYQLGFETNKKRKILKGCLDGEDKNIRINNQENIILGTFGYFKDKLDSLGVLYVNIKEYLKKYYVGYFELKSKLKKDENFKKKIEDNIENISEVEKYLVKTALLPDAVF